MNRHSSSNEGKRSPILGWGGGSPPGSEGASGGSSPHFFSFGLPLSPPPKHAVTSIAEASKKKTADDVPRSKFLEGYSKDVGKMRRKLKQKRNKKVDPRHRLPETFSPRGWNSNDGPLDSEHTSKPSVSRKVSMRSSVQRKKQGARAQKQQYPIKGESRGSGTFDKTLPPDCFGYSSFTRKFMPKTRLPNHRPRPQSRKRQETLSTTRIVLNDAPMQGLHQGKRPATPSYAELLSKSKALPGPKWGFEASYPRGHIPKGLSTKSIYLPTAHARSIWTPMPRIKADRSCYAPRVQTPLGSPSGVSRMGAKKKTNSCGASYDHVAEFVGPVFTRKKNTVSKLQALVVMSSKSKSSQ